MLLSPGSPYSNESSFSFIPQPTKLDAALTLATPPIFIGLLHPGTALCAKVTSTDRPPVLASFMSTTQARVVLEEKKKTLTKKIPSPDWPSGKPAMHFFLLMIDMGG